MYIIDGGKGERRRALYNTGDGGCGIDFILSSMRFIVDSLWNVVILVTDSQLVSLKA